MFKRVLYVFFSGCLLSIPAGLLIFHGLRVSRSPDCWIAWGIVFVLGVPCNLIALAFSVGLFVAYTYSAQYLKLPQLLQFNGFAVLVYCFIVAGIIGSHVNGILVAQHLNRKTAVKRSRNVEVQ